jgi:hypothetical protein
MNACRPIRGSVIALSRRKLYDSSASVSKSASGVSGIGTRANVRPAWRAADRLTIPCLP